ncbi:hypothetical protein NMG60_11022134 [Bertholletia excelsa]
MSRQAHLPPRCPFQKKTITQTIYDPASPTSSNDIELYHRHQKSISQSFVLEDQPAWLDDLLNESETDKKGKLLRRSASDSVTLLDGLVSLPCLAPLIDYNSSSSSETTSILESACTYGPNSPRNKGRLNFPEDSMVSALSDYLSCNHVQCLNAGLSVSGVVQSDLPKGTNNTSGETKTETKSVKRHSGQRSRVRKLQYIAELERTVEVFQTLGADLTVSVASQFQSRLALSVENSKLKQQLSRLQQEKMFLDDQYQFLKKEVERLKSSVSSCNSRAFSDSRSSSGAEGMSLEAVWQMLDMGKLHLN